MTSYLVVFFFDYTKIVIFHGVAFSSLSWSSGSPENKTCLKHFYLQEHLMSEKVNTTFSRWKVLAKIELESLLNIKSVSSTCSLRFFVGIPYFQGVLRSGESEYEMTNVYPFSINSNSYFAGFCLVDFREQWRWKAEAGL